MNDSTSQFAAVLEDAASRLNPHLKELNRVAAELDRIGIEVDIQVRRIDVTAVSDNGERHTIEVSATIKPRAAGIEVKA